MSTSPGASFLQVGWPAPPNVSAVMTTRQGGVSKGAYKSFNLATHVGDEPDHVMTNRQQLNAILELDPGPCWMNQVHGNRVVEANLETLPEADAIYTRKIEQPLGVMVADCVPVLVCDADGTCVAAIHAGWKGLACGILQALVSSLPVHHSRLMAWLGPAIGPCHYEVGAEVKEAFAGMDACFTSSTQPEHWMMDMWAVASMQLKALGVGDVYGGNLCTYCDATNFFSYRRDGQGGRMAAIIWLNRRNSSR